MEKPIPKKIPFLTPCLPLEPPERSKDKEETKLVTFTLKVRAGSSVTATTYKMKVHKFDDGTPAEWIEVLDSLEEIWKQNSLSTATDREASIKTILREDSLTAFESSIDDSRRADAEEALAPLDLLMITTALEDVSKTIFPHRALEIQRLWMRRAIRKPKDMLFRKFVAIVTKMNKSLLRFPSATEDSKFNSSELLEILEWSLPIKWRAKFDLDRYSPSLHSKARLIAEAEAMERSEEVYISITTKGDKKNTKTLVQKKSAKPKYTKGTGTEFYCTQHGKNSTHGTVNCYTLKNREGANNKTNDNNFSKNKFRKEIHLMSKARGKNKTKILDLFAAEIKKQRATLAKKQSSKRKAKKVQMETSDSESDDEHSLHQVDSPMPEEKDFQQRLSQLGQMDESEGETSSTSSK